MRVRTKPRKKALPPKWSRSLGVPTLLDELWTEMGTQGLIPVDRWLSHRLKGHPDRQALSEAIFAAHRFAVFALFAVTGEDIETFRHKFPGPVTLQKALSRPRMAHRLWPWVEARVTGQAPTSIARGFESLRRELPKTLSGLCLWNGVPLWCESELEPRATLSAWTPSDLERFVRAQGEAAPVWIRLNQEVRSSEVWTELERGHFEIQPAGQDPKAWKVRGVRSLYEFATFKAGWFEIQDFASQQIGRAVESKAGQMVWDACAGVGGKTLQLAAQQGPKGAIYASDTREKTLKALKLRARRAGFSNIRIVPWDATQTGEGVSKAFAKSFKEVQLRNGFHWVLVDAPCTASGTWQRNPWERFRFGGPSSPDVKAFNELQLKILIGASQSVRPGGHLVYATCSWYPSENEKLVEGFLKAHTEFRLHRQALHGSPQEDSDTTFTATFVRGERTE